MMTRRSGSVRTSSSVSLTCTRGPTTPGMGGTNGRAPVLMNACAASMVSRVPSGLATVRCVASANEAAPSTTSTFGRSASLR